jgi:hypothetical protein
MSGNMECKIVSLVLILTFFGLYPVCDTSLSQGSPPVLEVDSTAVDFGETDTSKTFAVTNSGGDTLEWSLHEDEEWMSVDVTSGSLESTMSETVTVEVDRSKVLTSGEITGTITITSNDGSAEIEVTMIIPPPVLEVDSTAMDFGETDTSKTFTVTNSGGGTLEWSLYEDAEWMSVDVTSGSLESTMSETVTVEVDRSKVLTLGVINSTITVTANDESTTIEVTMIVLEQPVIEVSPLSLDFDSKYVVRELTISNTGTGILDWIIDTKETWFAVDQETGQTNEGETDEINIIVDRSAATELGGYSGELGITSDGGDVTVRIAMEKINHVPEIPAVISPVDGATKQSLYTTLAWQGGDIDTGDGDTITYDVYFSTNKMLVDIEDVSVLTCSDMKVFYCEPGTNSLDVETTYHWKVVAKDSYGEITSGSVWNFTTENNAINLCPAFALGLDYGELSLLRELRDNVLTKDETGKNYVNLYYHYSWELFLILFINDELGVKTGEVFKELIPVIRSLLIGREVFVTVEMMGEVKELIGKITSCASPQLKAALNGIQADIRNREKMETLGIIIDEG